jgi:hypothetical protein
MRFSIPYLSALLLLLGLFGCSRPVEQSPAASTPAQPTAESATTPAPAADQSGKTEAPQPAETRSQAAGPARAAKKQTAPASAPAAPPPVGTAASQNSTPAPAQTRETVKIPAGTILTVTMIDAVGTDTNKAGDTFTASIAEPVVINGKTALAKGMKVQGRVQALDEPGRVKGKAAITLVLTQLLSKDKARAITTEPFTAEAEAGTKKDALKVGGGAALGAIVGAIAGGKKGAAVGAAIGGGAGTTAVLATRGDHIKLDSETKVNFVLKNDIDVDATKSTS